MIVIRVELWSAITGERSEIARMVMDNIGGTMHRGDYRSRVLRGRTAQALNRSMIQMDGAGTVRSGKVLGHPRLREHVWNLVAKALAGMGYGTTTGGAA